jgi:hypothetical protein
VRTRRVHTADHADAYAPCCKARACALYRQGVVCLRPRPTRASSFLSPLSHLRRTRASSSAAACRLPRRRPPTPSSSAEHTPSRSRRHAPSNGTRHLTAGARRRATRPERGPEPRGAQSGGRGRGQHGRQLGGRDRGGEGGRDRGEGGGGAGRVPCAGPRPSPRGWHPAVTPLRVRQIAHYVTDKLASLWPRDRRTQVT